MTAKPAARQGDPTQHGGQLGGGSSRVFIDGKPAATVGDPQQCPLSDGTKPHVGGSVTGGSTKVQIGGKAAARTGDPVSCGGGAPNSIALGSAKVCFG
jgi:uncharacterized Zn-binding protein involved in type VI secretion